MGTAMIFLEMQIKMTYTQVTEMNYGRGIQKKYFFLNVKKWF